MSYNDEMALQKAEERFKKLPPTIDEVGKKKTKKSEPVDGEDKPVKEEK